MAAGFHGHGNSTVILPRPENLSEDPEPGDLSDLPRVPRRKGTDLTGGVWRNWKPLPSVLAEWVGWEEMQVGKVGTVRRAGEKWRDSNPWSAEKVG